MPDILIRDLPDHVVAAIDAKARRLGLSRNEYLRRELSNTVPERAKVTVEDLVRSSNTFADVNDRAHRQGLELTAATTWLVDKSAYVRLGEAPDATEWAERIERGLVRITTVTRLELGFSARSPTELRSDVSRPPLSSMPVEYVTPGAEDRAVEVQLLLADQGRHRAPSIPDLLVAAAAELAGLTVLHVDKDFELIAEVTGQPLARIAAPGRGSCSAS